MKQIKKYIACVSIIILFIISLFFPTLEAFATEEIITMQFKDKNFYNGVAELLEEGDYVIRGEETNETEQEDTETDDEETPAATPISIQKSDENLTIQIAKEDVEKVTSIVLNGKNITNIEGIENFTNLEEINFLSDEESENKNQITDITPLKDLVHVKFLTVDHNEISYLGAIQNLKQLQLLDLCYNPIVKNLNLVEEFQDLDTLWLLGLGIDTLPNIEKLTKLQYLYLDQNYLEDISKIDNIKNLEVSATSNTIRRTINRNGKQSVTLPQIIKEVKNTNSKLYTSQDYILEGCTLSEDGSKIIIDTDKVESASITVVGGIAEKTTMEVTVEGEQETPKEEKKENNITKDNTMAPAILPYTGLTEKILMVVCLLGVIVMIMYFKYKQYKDIQ